MKMLYFLTLFALISATINGITIASKKSKIQSELKVEKAEHQKEKARADSLQSLLDSTRRNFLPAKEPTKFKLPRKFHYNTPRLRGVSV